MPNPPLILRRRDARDDWHFQPGCPRWPKDRAPFEEMPAAQFKRGRGIVCERCVKIGGYHRGRVGPALRDAARQPAIWAHSGVSGGAVADGPRWRSLVRLEPTEYAVVCSAPDCG